MPPKKASTPPKKAQTPARKVATVAKRSGPEIKVETSGVVMLLFSKCTDGVAMVMALENYGLWGAPSARILPGQTPEQAVFECLKNELGYDLTKKDLLKHHSFRFWNTQIFLGFTEKCVDSFNEKNKNPDNLIGIYRMPCKVVYDAIAHPQNYPHNGEPIKFRTVFTKMMTDHKKDINDFINQFCK